MGRVLKRLPQVPWGQLQDSEGSARHIPALLSTVARGAEAAASAALDELGDRVCALGFVVSEATPQVVPFLLELAGDDAVRKRAEILELLSKIYSARQWESAAGALSVKEAGIHQEKIAWEVAGRDAVLAGTGVFQKLLDDANPEVSGTARDLLSILA
ncbi:hypothetical protein JHN63_50290 [Streptomyces sp. MBT65]|uniref:hypothetical protein n=1 Tax=Streptomyces sp. MBT65 TaxID=1488395 RepID=UPI00190B8A84|nr:hypothetical protein [Streptomyces sp. MBT65]MBK3581807.1 hypothetical protein [Streptomyces sp. MBT65]